MLSARALDIVSGLESMSERTQMLTPGRRRRRERLIRPERHPPFAAVVAPYLLPGDIEGLLWLSGRRQHQRLAGSSRKRSRSVDERCRQQSPSPNQKMSTIEHVCSPSVCTRIGEQDDLLLPAGATSSFTTVAGQGWLAGHKALSGCVVSGNSRRFSDQARR